MTWTAPAGAIPRGEFPRPRLMRETWLNLNGVWQFEIDHGDSGRERGLVEAAGLSGTITVPFCPESALSGVAYKDFMAAVWYKREIALPESWTGGRVLLHVGAADHAAEAWVNGQSVGVHKGGYCSFSREITQALRSGANTITICARDNARGGRQPRGKQSESYQSRGCDYTRTTGIWQTVWLEYVPPVYICSLRSTPDAVNGRVHIEAAVDGDAAGMTMTAAVSYEGAAVGQQSCRVEGSHVRLTVELSEIHLWEAGHGRLYDLQLTLAGSGGEDCVSSYFGLRSVGWSGKAMQLNGRNVFQRLVLDQGYYPDGIYTAPSDEALKADIELSMALGFNGARLHQKVFEPRFLYWADRLGYLVWGEYASWGLDITTSRGLEDFLPEWIEVLQRDYSHPSIVGWCPFNETWDRDGTRQNDEVLRIVYLTTKAIDPTRPVIDTSGHYHVATDIFDVHDYEQDPQTFTSRYDAMNAGGEIFTAFPDRQRYDEQPYFVSEYGGIWWNPGQTDDRSWGYGHRPNSEAEFLQRYAALTGALLNNPSICAFCYTQLTDIEQEVNGLYTYDRKPKFDPAAIRAVNAAVAAIERQPS